MRMLLSLSAAAVLLVCAACGNTSTEQQTLNAFDENHATNLANIHTTATVQIERLLVTVERAQTRAARATQELGFMISTLEARGTETVLIPQAIAQAPTAAPNVAGGGPPTPIGQALNVMVTPFAPTPDATALAQSVGVSNVVLSSRVGNDDCAIAPTNEFRTDTPEIYIVAVADFAAAETTVVTRWLRGDTQLAQFSFSYGQVEGNCIWFFIDQTDFEFVAGNYMVIMEVDGVALPPRPFTLIGDAMLEQSRVEASATPSN